MRSTKKLAIRASVSIMVVGGIVLLVPLNPQTANFSSTFMERCEKYGESSDDCENLLNTFQQAYVGKEQCGFAEGNYDKLLTSYHFDHLCDKTVLWSGIKDDAQRFAENTGRITLERTLLGSVLDGQKWCGMEGNKETFTNNCKKCKPNPVRAFWRAISAKFAEYACGTVTVILNGKRKEPYHPRTTFARVEVPKLQPSKVTHLQVKLVQKKAEGQCSCDSLGNLRKDLDYRISCSCQVTSSGIGQ